MKLLNRSTNSTISFNLKIANTLFSRLKGLLFKKELISDEALWLIPCNSIHMVGMRFAIDAVYLDHNNEVVRLAPNLKPNTVGPIDFKAHSVIELPAGSILRTSISICDKLEAAA